MKEEDGIKTLAYLANELRKAHETVIGQNRMIDKLTAEVRRLQEAQGTHPVTPKGATP